jgi:SagB-type dehydrogenase family enzyme
MYRIFGIFMVAISSIAQVPRDVVTLPTPRTTGGMALDQALLSRASVREFLSTPLTWAEIGQLLWAAQGITHDEGKRTAPSAGATYPLELYVATADGLFQYRPNGHSVTRVTARDLRRAIRQAGGGQDALDAPVVFAFAAVPARTAARYGERAMRYVQIEIGHAGQNLLLEAAALGLGAVPVGAFSDADLHRVLGLPADRVVLYLMPVGHVR